MSPKFEREYFSLAAVWLHCREQLLSAKTSKDRMWFFLGEIDYHTEMAIMIKEETSRLKARAGLVLVVSSPGPETRPR
jgi:hypothetical protein